MNQSPMSPHTTTPSDPALPITKTRSKLTPTDLWVITEAALVVRNKHNRNHRVVCEPSIALTRGSKQLSKSAALHLTNSLSSGSQTCEELGVWPEPWCGGGGAGQLKEVRLQQEGLPLGVMHPQAKMVKSLVVPVGHSRWLHRNECSKRKRKSMSRYGSTYNFDGMVVGIMRVNVERVLERDQKLSELDDRAASQCPLNGLEGACQL
ncbi:Synaptobrevin-1 [Portunus trituberculatus]|uniref:Synaptobrevin-1 n=1 Tax=Portunus trituberculatus TaxID=210409 RepID=A0A5B7E9V4_PORTR|nr:Synaptobrevin-1 [Portunus trituberculatus]